MDDPAVVRILVDGSHHFIIHLSFQAWKFRKPSTSRNQTSLPLAIESNQEAFLEAGMTLDS
jgi:hypothetical protein